MSDVTVYMKPEAQSQGTMHQHNDVSAVVHDHYLRVAYNRSRLIINYPLTSIEKWENRT